MEFRILNPQNEWIATLGDIDSVQWLESYTKTDEVKAVVGYTPTNASYLQEENRIYNVTTGKLAIIKDVINSSIVGDEYITVRAVGIEKQLGDRVLYGTETIKNIETGLYSVITKNMRGLPLAAGTTKGYTDTIEKQVSWGSVLECVEEVCAESDFGFTANFTHGTLPQIEVLKGVDRTDKTNQTNYRGFLSTSNGTLNKIEVERSVQDEKNVCVVAGEGEGIYRKYETVALQSFLEGQERKEIYVDRRDLQKKYTEATQTGWDEQGNPIIEFTEDEYTDAEYIEVLKNAGYETLSENTKTLDVTCEVNSSALQYGTDFFLGDRLPINDKFSGIYGSFVIESAKRIYENDGERIEIELTKFKTGDETWHI